MKLDELRTVQSKERRKDSLQQLRDSFYEDVAAYIQDLTASRDRRAEQVDNPFSDNEVRRLSDELETAEEVAEAIYERRVGKVVKLASFAAAEMPVDDEGMTSEERRLFEDLVARIEQNKTAVLDVLSGSRESTTGGDPAAATGTAEPEPTPPPSPTERVAESEAEESADSMLADAMGSTADTAESGETATTTEAAPAADAAPAANAAPAADAAPQATEVPPETGEPEPDAILGTTDEAATDGATPTGSTDGRSDPTPAPEPPTAGSTQPETDSDSVGSTTDADGVGSTTDTGPTRSTDGGTVADAPPATTETATADSHPPADTDGAVETERPTERDTEDRTMVRITRDVGEIFGVDGREYTLQSEDVVTLPTANADPLVDRDAAMRLE